MARSFADSLKAAKEQKAVAALAASKEVPTVYTSDDWTLDAKYLYYPEYSDDAVSSVDAEKNILLDPSQINLTQETNSQFIPFELPRYYDGFDLQTTTILVHFLNKNGYEDYSNPINTYYNSQKIKFGWLIDKRVTAVEGRVQFEIQAVGTNSNGDEYVWKSKPSDGLNILKSLSGKGVIEPDDNWVTSLTERFNVIAQEFETIKSEFELVKGLTTEPDTTLTKEGYAADAKAVGDALASITVEVDSTLTVEGQAADSNAVGDAIQEVKDAIEALPIEVDETGYTDITGLRRMTNLEFVLEDQTVTMNMTLQGDVLFSSSLSIGENGFPEKYTEDGVECDITFTGFDNYTLDVWTGGGY